MRQRLTLKRTLTGLAAVIALASVTVARPVRADSVLPPPQHLKYVDSDGPGVLDIASVAADPATGGAKIQVRLVQNGVTYNGSGFRLRTFTPPPNSADMQTVDLIVFTLRTASGRAFNFRGQIREGGFYYHIEGGGAYEQAGAGTDIDNWKVSGP